MVVKIRAATLDDLPSLIKLLEEMDRFYGATEVEGADTRLDQAKEALFSAVPAAHALLAVKADSPVGFAAYSYLWPAVGLTRSLFLKELYVTESTRRQGVARLLMKHLAQIAHETDCSRVEWTTDDDNTLAQAFYEALGARVNTAKRSYRVQGADEIRRLREP